jgi:hypothetical protein
MAADSYELPSNLTAFLATLNTTSLPPSLTLESDLDLFFHCWIRPHCPACLAPDNPYPCSWCATSQTCVPNIIFDYPFGILSPIKSADICPLGWRERWEMRARPFSCRCSTMTLLTAVVAVLGTLVALLVIWMAVRLGLWLGRRWRARGEGWWEPKNWSPSWLQRGKENRDAATETEPNISTERTPLLA